MRKGFEALYGLVRDRLSCDPLSGHLFLFCNAQRNRSPRVGPKIAAILSVVETCRRLQVPARDYFSTILPGHADLPMRCLPDLTPAVWDGIHEPKRRKRGVKMVFDNWWSQATECYIQSDAV
jgi:hypothetical protein